jgi:hypothetical protein
MSFMFNLADYEPVEVRLEKFINDHKNFRISTELEVVEASRYIVKAYLFKDASDSVAWATGYAEETVTQRGVNQTSALENCETSAIGRALANAGYAPKGKRPSREEMTKVVAKKPEKPSVAEVQAQPEEQDYWTTPVGQYNKVVDAPVTLDKALETVAAIIGTPEAQEVPTCSHGSRLWKTGKSSKTGKEWANYSCPLLGHAGMEGKCEPIWYEVNSAGKWQPQKAWA